MSQILLQDARQKQRTALAGGFCLSLAAATFIGNRGGMPQPYAYYYYLPFSASPPLR
jgi:hypothetical protein